jgi:MoxR-like ATPase
MHLTGSNPGYSGNYIYWDEEAEKELGDIEVLDSDNEIKTVLNSRIWKITPGEGHIRNILWDIFVKNEVIGIGWFGNERDYSDFETLEDIKKELFNFYNRSMDLSARMIWDFTNNIKIGDIIVANSGYKGVLGIGIVKSEYIGPKNPDNPAKNFIRSDFDYYVHFRKVNWLINDEIEFNSQIFDQKTLTPIYGDKWEKIKEAYIKKSGHYEEIFDKIENYTHNQIRPEEIIKKLFDDFNNEYLSTEIGQNHLKAYTETSERFRSTLNEVEIKKSRNEDANDDILYGLVPHKGRDIVGFMSDIKAFFEKSLEINPNKFPEIADALYELIEELNKNDDNSEKQKEVIDSFVENGYSKGIGAGTLSPTLFFINHKYPLINSKTKTTSEFLSKLIKKPVNLDTSLINYINNKKSLETLIGDLSDYVPYFENFAIFDIFCHWMCDKNLGNYAVDQDKYKEWYKNKFGGPVIDDTDLDNNTLALHPEELDINLKLNPRILDQVCGTLNAGKHIMLTGAPGTGKTDLAESVCDIASSLNFTDGYILTTATSDWTTFDTIGGYMPDETGKLYFEEGKFLQSIRENKWLIIDEINRADIDKAFGQLFTVLSGQGVELPYKNNGNSIKIRRGDKNKSYYSSEDSTYYVGKNWRILATMNVYDKDYLFEMSYAFMRRFTFIYIDLPDDSDFKELIESWCDGLESDYVDSVCNLLRINEYRQIGPAIFKDISEYIKERKKMGNTDYMLNDAVLSYILPQFEGLEKIKIVGIWKILQELFEENDELKIRLEEIATVKLDESK